MKTERWTVTALFILSLVWAAFLHAQRGPWPVQAAKASIRITTEANQSLAGGVLKEIDDSCTGDRWLLVRDANHPAGPGRLVRITRTGRMINPGGQEEPALNSGERAAAPVIHAGDALVLEESTPLVEARLEARALGPAICGGEFSARLAVGGKVVRAVALGKGRAAFVSQTGMRP
jgi:hypothetical protein